MNLDDYRMIFIVGSLILMLLGASPILGLVIRVPGGERFSELWLLGPGHLAEGYPFNVTEGKAYSVFLGVSNHLGGLGYYTVYVKFRNQSEQLPNATIGTPSPLPPLYEYRTFLRDGETWEKNVTFSFDGVVSGVNSSTVLFLSLNGYSFRVDKAAAWDMVNKGYYFELFFELWLYDNERSESLYNSRFVGLWLNVTSASMF